MSCNKCNEYNPCKQKSCGCPVKDLYSNCVNVGLGVLPCSGINADDTLDNVLLGLEQFICDKVDSVTNFLQITNIGTGSEIYAGDNVMGAKQLRTLTSTDGSVNITENEDVIDFNVTIPEAGGLISVGTGNPIYVGQDGDDEAQIASILDTSTDHTPIYTGYENGNHKIAGLTSDSLSIEQDGDGNIQIENPPAFTNDGIPRFIVNNLYTGDEELGTVSKPFKTIQNAIDAFVGTGNAEAPQFQNGIIIIQKGNIYNFSGTFNYRNINIILEEGAKVYSNPGLGNFLMDYDTLDGNIDSISTITLRESSELRVLQKGFKNRGSNDVTETGRKIININGSGLLRGEGPYDETFSLIEDNYENLPDYGNNGPNSQFNITDIEIRSRQPVWRLGNGASVVMNNVIIRFNNVGGGAQFRFFNQIGGHIYLNNSEVVTEGNLLERQFVIEILDSTTIPPFFYMRDNVFQTNSNITIFMELINESATNSEMSPEVQGYHNKTRFSTYSRVFEDYFTVPINIKSVSFRGNIFETGVLQNTVGKIDFTQGNSFSALNQIGENIVENLRSFTDRAAATADPQMTSGCKFFNTTTDAIDVVI